MTRRHGPERNKQPAATRKAVPETIYRLSHDGNKTCNRGSGNNSNTQISKVNFRNRAEQGLTPREAVPSLVDLEPAAGNDSNNTLI